MPSNGENFNTIIESLKILRNYCANSECGNCEVEDICDKLGDVMPCEFNLNESED